MIQLSCFKLLSEWQFLTLQWDMATMAEISDSESSRAEKQAGTEQGVKPHLQTRKGSKKQAQSNCPARLGKSNSG